MPIIREIARPERAKLDGSPPGVPPLTSDHLLARLGEATLRRGQPYVEDRNFDTRRTQRTLKAQRDTLVKPKVLLHAQWQCKPSRCCAVAQRSPAPDKRGNAMTPKPCEAKRASWDKHRQSWELNTCTIC